MECRVTTTVPLPEPTDIEQALFDADPAAVFDVDHNRHTLRIATSLGVEDLRALLRSLGCEVSRDQIRIMPSICCGGCSG